MKECIHELIDDNLFSCGLRLREEVAGRVGCEGDALVSQFNMVRGFGGNGKVVTLTARPAVQSQAK